VGRADESTEIFATESRRTTTAPQSQVWGVPDMDQTESTDTVMMLCPNLKCAKVLRVPQKCRGKQVRCHFCNFTFRVPDAKPEETDAGEKLV